MNLELNSRTLILAMMIALGLSLEALKLWPSSAGAPTKAAAVIDHLLNSKPYSVSDRSLHKMITAPKAALPKLTVPVAVDLKALATKAADAQSKSLADVKKREDAAKGWHWVFNRKLGQWVWKKKSAKKPKEDNPTDVAQTIPKTQLPDTSANANAGQTPAGSVTGGGLPTPATSGYGAALSPDLGTRFLSQSEWEALLLKSANTNETKYFVQQYKQHMVTDNVFYAVISQMVKSSNVEIQQQGVLALSLTPSVESFVQLATLSATQSSALAQSVTTALSAYGNASNLGDLKDVLQQQQSNSAVLTAALTQLQNAINTNLHSGGSGPTAQGGSNAALFSSFIPVLQTLANNSAVAGQVQNILGQLNQVRSVAQN